MKGICFACLYSKYTTKFKYSLLFLSFLDRMLSSSPVITSSSHVITALSSLHAADRCSNIAAAPCWRTLDHRPFICAPAMILVTVLPFCSPQAALFHRAHLCCTLTASHTRPIKATPGTCCQSAWLGNDSRPPHIRCQAVCVRDSLVLLSALVSCCQPYLNLSIFFNLLFYVYPPGFGPPVPLTRFPVLLQYYSSLLPVAPCWADTLFVFPPWFQPCVRCGFYISLCLLQTTLKTGPAVPVRLLCCNWVLNTPDSIIPKS